MAALKTSVFKPIRSGSGTPVHTGRFHADRQIERKSVLTSFVVSIVRICTRFATATVVAALVVAVGAGLYTARNFKINTDINTLISPDLDWRQRDIAFEKAFDQKE